MVSLNRQKEENGDLLGSQGSVKITLPGVFVTFPSGRGVLELDSLRL